MLRDKLVVGVRSENLQKRLLQEGDDATLDKIYEIALSYEAAERDLLSMKKVDYADANVHDVKKLNSACFHCGRHNHLSNKCFFKNAKCHECGKIGHIKPACKNRKTKFAKIQHGSKATGKINVVEASENGKYFITLNVDNKNIQFEFDTGSCHTPKIEDIFAILGRGINFSKIDLSQAYLQLELGDNSKEMAVINTYKGLYRYNRLPFGIASAPAIWQRIIEQILSGIPGTLVYLDDILITGESEADHLRYLEAVLNRLNEYGLKANREKCNFFQESLEYCGHVIDKMGLHKTNDKIRAVLDAPEPLNVTQLRAFLGLITYYHKFIRNAADAFRQIKEIISSDQILIAYDPKLPIRLSCDSSSYGLGAVLSQIDVDGNERPIYFISRTLSQAEKKYSQIDKECLSIIWALKKFNNYLFGRKFELITDNKPLHHILNPKREISSNMSARLQRWALILSSYNFTIECRKTGDHGNADGLSRLPLEQYEEMEEDAVNTVHMIKQCEELPLTSSHIRRESCKDSILKIVYQNTLNGWKDKPSNTELLSFYLRIEELTWPGIDPEIGEITRVCRECNINNHTLKQESVHRWESAPTPWYRVHLDFAGPFMNKMFLIVIDSYSKWPEVIIMNLTTAGNTIRVLRDLFSRYGIPDQVVTDNGPQFVSEEMKYFFKSNGVHHLRSAPYFPATNGLAERFVQTLKRGLKNMRNEELNNSLANFLFTYRTVPHSSTREAPAVLFLKRMLKCKWNLLKPKLKVKPGFKKGYSPDFEEDEDILVRDFLGPNKWKEGKIIKRLGKCFYTVKLNDGRLWRRHVCQLRKSYIAPSPASEIFLPEQLINYPRNESRAGVGSVESPVSPSKENIPSSSGISAPEEPDTSDSAIGGVIQQKQNGMWRPVAFFSKKLNNTQKNYSTYDRELLSIYLSIKHFKYLLEGREFVIFSNHKPLIYALMKKSEKATPRQLRQLQFISQFSTDIRHIKGQYNIVADALSRIEELTLLDYDEIAERQRNDEELRNLQSTLKSLNFKQYPLSSGKYLWCDTSTNHIRPYIPESFRFRMFQQIQGLSHPGIRSTAKQMSSKFIWTSIKKDVRQWARCCIPCQKKKKKITLHTKSNIGEFQDPMERFTEVHIDLVGTLPLSNGNTYCLTCIDRFSNWMEVVPLENISAERVAKAFYENWISRFGTPHRLISDQGAQFTSEAFKCLSRLCEFKLQHTTAYHPQCNGKVERLHRTIKVALRTHDNLAWSETLPTVLLGLRTALQEDTKLTIAKMVYGQDIRPPGEFLCETKILPSTETFAN
ncbi:K02A2.6-like [Cordylochernes scorpioides]|uniref:RNA-directed DNA polymerase n=1 Tax=Cordylochernes scorpioides TaxID=51811 RepID=A0ABY6K6Z5_9ARAC|nr:K02A2.6-like [Cordylochernes scorpioides]